MVQLSHQDTISIF